MRPNAVKARLNKREPVLGTWLSLASPLVAEMCGSVGFDWLAVDMEHSAVDYGTVQAMLQAISIGHTVPYVLVPTNDAKEIKRSLDIGAYGIVVPNVKTPEEAERAVRACRYPPDGFRGVGSVRGPLYGGPDYYEKANSEISVVVMIEDAEAVNRIADIMQIPGIDAFHIGPYDLAASLGVPFGLDNPHPDHKAAVQRVLAVGRRLDVPVGIHCGSAEEVVRRMEQGFRWLALATDARLLFSSVRDALSAIGKTS